MNEQRYSSINKRALTSLFLFFAFVWLVPSGILLHIFDSAPFQPTRHALMTVHNTASIIFLVSALVHLSLNWKAMLSYMKAKSSEYALFKKEFVIAAVTVTGLLALGLLHVFVLGNRLV